MLFATKDSAAGDAATLGSFPFGASINVSKSRDAKGQQTVAAAYGNVTQTATLASTESSVERAAIAVLT